MVYSFIIVLFLIYWGSNTFFIMRKEIIIEKYILLLVLKFWVSYSLEISIILQLKIFELIWFLNKGKL